MATDSGRKRRPKVLLVLAILVAVIAAMFYVDNQAAKNRLLVTISKETTYITEPLRADGYPDYIAALNQRFSEGVTPENNSAVLFWQAVGPSEIMTEQSEIFFQMLGISPLPEKGDYFVTSSNCEDAYVAQQKSKGQPVGDKSDFELSEPIRNQFNSAMKRPWSPQEFPVWAEWIAANEKPLAMLVEATKRPRRYDPLIGATAIGILLPGAQLSRDVARALVSRAMLRVQEGKVEEAWKDLLACHRLARLVGQGPTLIEVLVAITVDNMALAGDRALLEHGKLTSAQIAAMREDLAGLPPMPKMVKKVDEAERFMLLDCVAMIAREGPGSLAEFLDVGGGGKSKNPIESLVESIGMAVIDWDLILRMGNSWYDRLVVGMSKPTRAERKAALCAIADELKKHVKSARDLKSLATSMLGGPSKAISERVGHILVAMLTPAFIAASLVEDRAMMQFELTELAFALAAYRADHGAYPAKLAELVPKYVKAIPKDIFNNDADLHYTRQDDGYLLYSFGPNGTDDGGKGFEERRNLEVWNSKDWDDITVRVPSKP